MMETSWRQMFQLNEFVHCLVRILHLRFLPSLAASKTQRRSIDVTTVGTAIKKERVMGREGAVITGMERRRKKEVRAADVATATDRVRGKRVMEESVDGATIIVVAMGTRRQTAIGNAIGHVVMMTLVLQRRSTVPMRTEKERQAWMMPTKLRQRTGSSARGVSGGITEVAMQRSRKMGQVMLLHQQAVMVAPLWISQRQLARSKRIWHDCNRQRRQPSRAS